MNSPEVPRYQPPSTDGEADPDQSRVNSPEVPRYQPPSTDGEADLDQSRVNSPEVPRYQPPSTDGPRQATSGHRNKAKEIHKPHRDRRRKAGFSFDMSVEEWRKLLTSQGNRLCRGWSDTLAEKLNATVPNFCTWVIGDRDCDW